MRALAVVLVLLGASATATAQVVPTPLHGPAAFDVGTQVRVLTALAELDTQVGLGVAHGKGWWRVAASIALDAAEPVVDPDVPARVPENSKERYEPPPSQDTGDTRPHAALFVGVAPPLFEIAIDDVRRIGVELLVGIGADFFLAFEDDEFWLRFGPEVGIGVRAQLFEFAYLRVVVGAERDLTELLSDLSDATFVARGAVELGVALPEPQPALDEVPPTTELRVSLAAERPVEASVTRPGSYFVTVGVAY